MKRRELRGAKPRKDFAPAANCSCPTKDPPSLQTRRTVLAQNAAVLAQRSFQLKMTQFLDGSLPKFSGATALIVSSEANALARLVKQMDE